MNKQKIKIGKIDKKLLLRDLKLLRNRKILVIGDVGLDEYIMGDVRRISPEAPVQVVEVVEEDMRLGLAANVALNIQAMGGKAEVLSVVGGDEGAERLRSLFRQEKLNQDNLFSDRKRPTTRKTRIMAKHHHIVRVDRELRQFLPREIEKKLETRLLKILPKVDAVILEDYAKGLISNKFIQFIVKACKAKGKKLFVDPHRNNVGSFYQGVDFIKPNYDEALALTGLDKDDLGVNPRKIYQAGRSLQEITGAKNVVITRGKDGMIIFAGEEITEVPTYAKKVFDVTGAGDTVIAALALAQSAGLDLVHSCILANFAAGIVVAKIGCVPCSYDELAQVIKDS